MSDAGTRFTDERQAFLESKFERIYRQAQEEIIEKLDAHTKRQNAQTRVKLAQVKAGTLSEEEFNKWQAGQMFIGKQWKDKVDSVATTLLTANQQANSMVEGEKRAVFGENATFQAYKLEHDAGVDLSFSVYDSATVTRLLRDDPELLPRKRVNGRKDKAWNRRKISDAVAQGIIQGESVDEIAKRIAKQTSNTNKEAMKRYARTAMTAAQNAGRLEVMEEAKDAGIKVKKRWIATLDRRTREAHQHLDGQVQETDKPFWSMLGYIMYPGDPDAKAANTWMCRCTLGYEYDEYPQQYSQRRAYVEYYDDDGEFHRESHEIANMTYDVWKLAKQRDEQRALEARQESEKGEEKKEAPKEVFMPAKTRQEAEEYAKRFSRNVNYSGISVENCNKINETLLDLYQKYPSTKMYELIQQYSKMQAVAKANWESLNINGKKIGSSESNIFEMNQLADQAALKAMRKRFEGRKVPPDMARQMARLENNLKYQRFSVAGQYGTRGYITHEFGHTIADQYIGQINDTMANPDARSARCYELREMVKQAREEAFRTGDIFSLGKYGASNDHEYFAEVFCAHEMGEKLPDYAEKMLTEVLGNAPMR